MKNSETQILEKSEENKEKADKKLTTNLITTNYSLKEKTKKSKLTFFYSLFLDTSLETNFMNEKKTKNICYPRIFKIMTIIYVIINICLLPFNNIKNEYTNFNNFSIATSYTLAGLNLITIIFNFYATKCSNFFKILFIEYVIFSSSHFVLINQIREMNIIKTYENVSIMSTPYTDFINGAIPFIFSFSDILLKFIFIFSSMNNFIYLFWATIGNVLIIILFFITSGQINFQYCPIALTFYFIGNIILNFISRKFTSYEKILFCEKIFNIECLKNVEDENMFLNSLNCGYFKIHNNQIKKKNNFFEQEFEALKNIFINKQKNSDKNLVENINSNNDSILKRQKTNNLKKENSSKSITDSTRNSISGINIQNFNNGNISNLLTNDDCLEILKNLLLNIPDSEKFKIDLNLFLENFIKSVKYKKSIDEKKSIETVLKLKGSLLFANSTNRFDIESSSNYLLDNNNLCKEHEKQFIDLPLLNHINTTPNILDKKFSNLINQEENVFLTNENINNNLINSNNSLSSRLERGDTKITISNFMRSHTFNKDVYISPRKVLDHPKEKDSNAPLQNLNTSIIDRTYTVINTNTLFPYYFFDYFTFNKSKFEIFTNLGRSTITYGSDKILSLDIFARVNEDNSIEFIFNDISKIDYVSGLKQFLIKTGQYLHDFKNPLICIQNEISEIKEEIEVLMAMIIKNNEFIDGYIKQIINISGATGSTASIPAKKIEFSLQECLMMLDKFEYTRQMSEYCQSMIGSYEDFSKSIFTPQKLNICIQNFDLFNLLNFIDSMMQFQLTRSNKNLNFVLKLENFESELEHDTNDMITSNNEMSPLNNKFLERKNSFGQRKLTAENFQNIQTINRKNTITSLNVYDNNSKLQITEKELEIFEKPEIIGSDEAKIKRVLINILSNSQKFTISGSITLTVKKEISNGIKYYKFSITDTGIGMSPEDLEKLFTPFFSNNNNEMNKNGVGLGLINVKEITEHLGNGLQITSELGKGTTMSFVIEDRFIDPNSNNNIFIEKTTLNNINEVSENIESDSEKDNDTTQEVCREHFNLIHKKLPKLDFIEDGDSDRNFYSNKNENQKLNNYHISVSESKDHVQENFENTCNNQKNSDLTCMSNTLVSTNQLNIGSPYLRTGYSLAKLFPQITTRNLNKTNSKFVRNISFDGLARQNSTMNIIRSDTIKNPNMSPSYQKNSPVINRRKLAFNSLIISNSKFFEKVNNIMKNPKSNSKTLTTFTNLTIHSDFNFEITRSYERYEKEIKFNSNNCYGSPKLKATKKSSYKSLSQFRFTGNIGEEVKKFEDDKDGENNSNYSKTLNILLIDDENSIRAFTKNSFKKISESENIKFNIEEADDGISGLAKILYKFLRDQETFDLVISDDTMNFLDGTQLFKLIGLLIDNEFFKRKLPENIVKKFLICSSDSDNVKNKIYKDTLNIENSFKNNEIFNCKYSYLQNSLEIIEKPLNQKVLKQFC